jgi:regulator of protease activity HflC (stomatin/prohibitin superfamily)
MNKKAQVSGFIATFFVVLIIGFFVLVIGFDTVGAGHVGVTNTFGEVGAVALEPGIHWTGLTTSTIDIDVRNQKVEYETVAASKDLQNVPYKVAVNFQLKPQGAVNMYKTVGIDYANVVLLPVIQQAVIASVAEYTAEEVTTKLPELTNKISEKIKSKFVDGDIIILEVSTLEFDYSEKFNSAIEAKQEAEQLALQALNEKRKLITESEARAEKQMLEADANAYAIKINADAEAYRLRVVNDELAKAKDLIQYNAINRWNGELPTYYTQPNSGGMLFNLPVEGSK